MKATGIVRRIDDLGRVVIPKEIRKTLRIREGDPLEIFTDRNGEVILKKYSPLGELGSFAKEYAESLQQSIGNAIIITDKDAIVTAVGTSKKEYVDKKNSIALEAIMKERKAVVLGGDKNSVIPIYEDDTKEKYKYQVVAPILAEGDIAGSVIIYSEEEDSNFDQVELKLAETAACFLGKQME